MLSIRNAFGLIAAAITLAVVVPAPPAFATDGEPNRHHVTLGGGYARHLSSDFEDSGLEHCSQGQFGYRYSVTPAIDLSLDGRAVMASQDVDVMGESGKFSHTTSYFGPGVRFGGTNGSVRPYMQANVFFVRETVRLEVGSGGSDASESGAGFGLAGGADIRLSHRLSLPIEASYLYAKPDSNVSSLGMQMGLTFNFGLMP